MVDGGGCEEVKVDGSTEIFRDCVRRMIRIKWAAGVIVCEWIRGCIGRE